MQNNPDVLIKTFSGGILFNAEESMYPSVMLGFNKEEKEFNSKTSTYYGFILKGSAKIFRKNLPPLEITSGTYFCVPGEFALQGDAEALIIERYGYRGMFTVGGPIESSGRLSYIDNCSTTQLIPPIRVGDPTLQALYFPPGTIQSLHIHPTLRFGLVFDGEGFCNTINKKQIPLSKGNTFHIPERLVHGFQTGTSGLTVIAYHPDTDVGPTDQSHPMLSRTYLVKQ